MKVLLALLAALLSPCAFAIDLAAREPAATTPMHETVILYAIPAFFLLIGVEMVVSWLRGRDAYRLDDAICSMSMGILSQISGVVTRLLPVGIYALVFDHLALVRWPEFAWWGWLLAIGFYDFCYYWLHRMGHQVALLWAAHAAHHQSEEFNLSTALRQTSTDALHEWIFFLPLALAGIPPQAFAAISVGHLLYQYWIHTQMIDRLGWFDRVFASPSNHRVHHAINDPYIDKNFGGILIIWDRLFGTFAAERHDIRIAYGTRQPLRSLNPLWANVQVYVLTARRMGELQGLGDKLQLWLRAPGWQPAPVAGQRSGAPFVPPATPFAPPLVLPRSRRVYCALQFAALLAAAAHFLGYCLEMPRAEAIAYFCYLLAQMMVLGALLEGRSSAALLEGLRLVATMAVVVFGARWFGVPRLAPEEIAVAGAAGLALMALLVWSGKGWATGPPAARTAMSPVFSPDSGRGASRVAGDRG